MDILIRVLAFMGTIISLGGMIFVIILNIKIRKMQKINKSLNQYIKNKSYLLMKNAGDDPCDTKKSFEMPLFSQESNYVVRRKMK